jgi:hypothetical protein
MTLLNYYYRDCDWWVLCYLVLVLIPFDPMQQYVPYNEGAVLLACGAVVYLFI